MLRPTITLAFNWTPAIKIVLLNISVAWRLNLRHVVLELRLRCLNVEILSSEINCSSGVSQLKLLQYHEKGGVWHSVDHSVLFGTLFSVSTQTILVLRQDIVLALHTWYVLSWRNLILAENHIWLFFILNTKINTLSNLHFRNHIKWTDIRH